MKAFKIGLITAGLLLTVQTVQAHPNHRIKRGVRSGQLTPREAKMLRVQKAHVRTLKVMARSDGRVTPRERTIINRSQRNLNRNIYRQKHDRQVRRVCR